MGPGPVYDGPVTTPAPALAPAAAGVAPPGTVGRPGGATRVSSARVLDLPTIARLRDFMPTDRARAWIIGCSLALVAFVTRVINLGYPSYLVFDETYYAKDAYSLLHFGYERQWPDPMEDTNKAFVAGDYHYLQSGPSFVVHPPLGKWIIAVGEQLFGVNSFGWRIMACLFGSLMVLVLFRLARRVARSTLVGAIAGLLLTVDGLAFTMSRIALLDIFQAFFLVAAVAAVVADRDWFRNRLADRLVAAGRLDLGGAFGRLALWRPWRWVAGIMFGAACAVKWNSIYVLAAFGVLSVLWDVGARRLGRAPIRAGLALLLDGLTAILANVLNAIAPNAISSYFTPNMYAYNLSFAGQQYNYSAAIAIIMGLATMIIAYVVQLSGSRKDA